MKEKLLIDLGGTTIKSILYKNLKYHNKKVINTDIQNPLKSLEELIKSYDLLNVNIILIAATGVINDGKVISVNGMINNYLAKDIRLFVQKLTNIKEVYVINDVNAFSYSINADESYFALMLGTGVGGAFVNQHNILLGEFGGSCEIGQIPYLKSTIDDYASTKGLVKIAQEDYKLNVKNGLELFNIDNMKIKHEILNYWTKHVAYVITLICYVYNPKTIYIAGAIIASKNVFQEMLDSNIKQLLKPTYYEHISIEYSESTNTAVFDGLVNYLKTLKK